MGAGNSTAMRAIDELGIGRPQRTVSSADVDRLWAEVARNKSTIDAQQAIQVLRGIAKQAKVFRTLDCRALSRFLRCIYSPRHAWRTDPVFRHALCCSPSLSQIKWDEKKALQLVNKLADPVTGTLDAQAFRQLVAADLRRVGDCPLSSSLGHALDDDNVAAESPPVAPPKQSSNSPSPKRSSPATEPVRAPAAPALFDDHFPQLSTAPASARARVVPREIWCQWSFGFFRHCISHDENIFYRVLFSKVPSFHCFSLVGAL